MPIPLADPITQVLGKKEMCKTYFTISPLAHDFLPFSLVSPVILVLEIKLTYKFSSNWIIAKLQRVQSFSLIELNKHGVRGTVLSGALANSHPKTSATHIFNSKIKVDWEIEAYRKTLVLLIFVENCDPQHLKTINMLNVIDIYADIICMVACNEF